ncbi:porin [Zoogloeaceae bacterium G21618-S1]|uniref:Porin n=1 Tax=Denitromonas halophila TaxID=1629404 RepID=A0A557QDA8_9RHOO|nr:porin [Denitromonas halophila]MCZ4303805.1 porin [Zoogloeaceae bacterium G21618-S1]TVO50887.1 porin [Denitromonas halophila]
MQKKLIALAIAGMIAAPAFAQSNVTVYGIIDTFVGVGKAGDAKFSGVANGVLNGPRIGFKGEEDLGNGLKAKFVLEQGFNSDDASPASSKEFHRQAWVGLEGGFGFIGLGRQYSPGYYAFRNDAVAAGALDPAAILTGGGLQVDAGSDARWDNSVNYQSKKFGGFSGQVIYSFGSTEADDKAKNPNRNTDDKVGLGLNYANGPLNVDYIYINAGDSTLGDDHKEHYLGAAYDFGGFKLVGSYQTASVDANDSDVKVYQIGGIVPVGMGNIHVAYGARNEDAQDSDSRSFTVAYTHNLSKRTIAYVGVNRTTNDDNVGLGALAKQDGKSSNALGLGIRHAF